MPLIDINLLIYLFSRIYLSLSSNFMLICKKGESLRISLFPKPKRHFIMLCLFMSFPLFCDAFPLIKKRSKKVSQESSVKDVKHPYDTLVANSKVRDGLFRVIEKKGNYYFEIPLSLMGRDMLVVNKLCKVSEELNDAGVNRGVNTDNFMIRLEYIADIKSVRIRKSKPMPEYPVGDAVGRSVEDNFVAPIIDSFKVETLTNDSSSVVVKVNDLFNGEKKSLNDIFQDLGLGVSPNKNLSRILSVNSFYNNVVAHSEMTTRVTEGNSSVGVTVEVSTSILLLPEHPMTGRFTNQRVGYFSVDKTYFNDRQQSLEKRRLITRWRLEPKPEDVQRYRNGELVEPIKPIVIWIDSRCPSVWRPWMIQGIESWNEAFERAGFKNAVQAKVIPDSIDADSDDVNYSVLNYAASAKINAMGPSIYDPRSGEIIEADIIWWHNVVTMLREWLQIQTGPTNPQAQTAVLPDSLMGEAVRFVACHEMGHSLGLRHNMMGSWTVPTDSLRSPAFMDKIKSVSASIMDYARFNYVAQPGDGVKQYAPHIGAYDKFAIEYGYRWTGASSPYEELNDWKNFFSRYNQKPYWYGEQQDMRNTIDPRSQIEDVGDDAVRSSLLGIENLKIVMKNLMNWSRSDEPMQDMFLPARLAYGVINQWNNYLYHVMASVGGLYLNPSEMDNLQPAYTPVEASKQKEALTFLLEQVMTYQDWLFNDSFYQYSFPIRVSPQGAIEQAPSLIFKNAQAYVMWDLLDNRRLTRMMESEDRLGKEAFTVTQLLDLMHRYIFASTEKGAVPDRWQRIAQKNYVDALMLAVSKETANKSAKKLMEDSFYLPDYGQTLCSQKCEHHIHNSQREMSFNSPQPDRISDLISLKRGALLRIEKLLQAKKRTCSDQPTLCHYEDLLLRINEAIR